MPKQVVMGAMMRCSFGTVPSALIVLPTRRVVVGGVPAANVMDYKPVVNIPTFGNCSSASNPAVASATAAAAGVLTPMPCVPATAAPWSPGSPTILIGNSPALNDVSKCTCTWGGVISITNPGQGTTSIP